MKKIVLAIGLVITTFVNAQDNWRPMEMNGFAYQAKFRFTQVFQNKLYVAADTNNATGLLLYSTLTGDTGSYTLEPGLRSVLKSNNEMQLTASAANNTYMFLGTVANYDTLTDSAVPQVYRYDGSSFVRHGGINFNFTSASSGYSSWISNLALYSPTGSNDTIYAFVHENEFNTIKVWKASASSSTPVWINSTTFSPASGIQDIYDATVWHNKLYITTSNNGPNGSMVLRTANGVDWDTVMSALSLQPHLGGFWSDAQFRALQVFRDTLITAVSSNYTHSQVLWYTADSLALTQTWSQFFSDTAAYSGATANWYGVTDMTVGDGKLWIQINYSNQYPAIYMCTKNAFGRDTLLRSSQFTNIEVGSNSANDYRLSYFNTAVYTSGITGMAGKPQRATNPGGASVGSYPGNIFRFKTVNPVASLVDSVYTGGYCQGNTIFLFCTATNAASADWFLNGTYFTSGLNVSYSPSVGGVDTIKMIAYNGTSQSLYKDSMNKLITVYWNPHIDTVSATSYTVCQGQPDTLRVKVSNGTAPYTYTWHNVPDNITYPGDSTTVIQLYVVPTPSPYVYTYVEVTDAHMCQGSGPYTTLYLYVNPSDSLSGTIMDTLLNPVTAGKVYLYKKQVNNMGIQDTLSVLGASGKYFFPSLYYGDYYVKAVADTSNPLYKSAVPTYYSNKAYGHAYQWDSAMVVLQHGCTGSNNTGNDIKIIQIPAAPTGPGEITGKITESNSFGARYSGPNAVFGAPLKGVDVKLGKNPGGSAAARTSTDSAGNYAFHNVPTGNYKIYVDIPNYGMDSVRLVNISSNDTSSHNDYYVDSTMVRVVPVDSVNKAICSGDSIMLAGAYQKIAGIYTDVLQSLWGYDSVIVTTLAIKPLPTLTVTANSYTVCSASPAVLTANGTAASYLWSSNAGSAATATTTVNPTANDTYTVTGTLNGCSVDQTVSVNIFNLPNVTANTTADTVCAGGSVTLTGGGASSYTWSSGVSDGVAFSPSGTVNYTVTGTDANSCQNADTITVVVKTCAGIKQASAIGWLNMYPNPAVNTLHIDIEKAARVRMYDITGQLVLDQPVAVGKNEINIANLPSGAYDLTVSADGKTTYLKVMVNK